ncbi:MAG: hypothetical protein IPM46_06890 [Flavobacteriales bacterium]|nr:hypothetical protein [Flavobacteriales bacterium]
MPPATERTRLAPTPSGYVHAGNAVNFLLTAAMARSLGAELQLRIDDLDAERIRPACIADIFTALDWLGIRWTAGAARPPRSRASFRADRTCAALLRTIGPAEGARRPVCMHLHPDNAAAQAVRLPPTRIALRSTRSRVALAPPAGCHGAHARLLRRPGAADPGLTHAGPGDQAAHGHQRPPQLSDRFARG